MAESQVALYIQWGFLCPREEEDFSFLIEDGGTITLPLPCQSESHLRLKCDGGNRKKWMCVIVITFFILSCWTFLSYHKKSAPILIHFIANTRVCGVWVGVHWKIISGDFCKHFSTPVLPKCSDSIHAVHGNSPPSRPKQFFPCYFTVRVGSTFCESCQTVSIFCQYLVSSVYIQYTCTAACSTLLQGKMYINPPVFSVLWDFCKNSSCLEL